MNIVIQKQKQMKGIYTKVKKKKTKSCAKK